MEDLIINRQNLSDRFRFAGFAAATALIVSVALTTFKTFANKPPETSAAQDSEIELRELGETLKAAVLSGTLSEEDATAIYHSIKSRLAPENAKTKGISPKDANGKYASKFDIMRLAAPRPGQITALLRPDFLRRDLQLLQSELDLGRDQMAIIEILFLDYFESHELIVLPFREGLNSYRQSSADHWVAAALDRATIEDVDVAVANTKDAIKQFEKASVKKDTLSDTSRKRAARDDWTERMIQVTANMEQRLEDLRSRVQARLAEIESSGSIVTANDLVSFARKLRDERAQLRAEFVKSLELTCIIRQTESEKTRFVKAIARVLIEHNLNHGRLGGESMNLWAALIDTARSSKSRRGRNMELYEIKMMLDRRVHTLAAKLDERMKATIDREVSGLEFLAARDGIRNSTKAREASVGFDIARPGIALRPFAQASKSELLASVAVRDELLKQLDESAELIDEIFPVRNLSTIYRDAAMKRGFRSEMRERWSERALKTALQLDDLDEESQLALVSIQIDLMVSLAAFRADAITKRIERDPKRALERIEAQLEEKNSRNKKFDLDEVLGFNHKQYSALDEQLEGQLKAILTAEQFASLPARVEAKSSKGSKGKAEKK